MDYTILQHFTITDDTTELKLQIEDRKILVILVIIYAILYSWGLSNKKGIRNVR